MNVIIAMDSFKGSLSSLEAGYAVKKGVLKAVLDANVKVFSLADGGEGTVDAFLCGANGKFESAVVTDLLGRKIESGYGIIDNEIVIIEIASVAGLSLLKEDEKNPLNTTTYGVGELIKAAVNKGYRKFIIGLGGSATNDAGIGMLRALGFDFLDVHGNQVSLGAKGLKDIVQIKDDNVIPELKECYFEIASDVNNPLCGKNGCSKIFAPQKGATREMIINMDKWLLHFSEVVKKMYPNSDRNIGGSGSAGGLGFAFMSFTNSILRSGIEIILEKIGIEKCIKNADIIVTGEGRMDSQTIFGKAPIGIAKLAKKYNKKVIAFCGCASKNAYLCNDFGIDAYFPIIQEAMTLDDAMKKENAKDSLELTAEQVFRLIK